MIQMHQVDLRYASGGYGLRGVSLALERGEFAFLTGTSGAGKTTLLRLLFGALKPTAGHVLVAGRKVARLSPKRLPELRRQIGVIFQDFKLLADRSVFDNVAVTLEIAGVPRREVRRRVWNLLKRLGLERKLDRRPLELSGGEQQRVAIARALVDDPPLLLADEPTGNLDPELGLEIMNILADAHARGATVIVATHDPMLMRKYPHRRLVLEGGRLEPAPAPERASPAPGRRDPVPAP